MNRKTMVIAISILIAFCTGIYFWAEWQKKAFDASLPEPPAPKVQAAETETEGGHWHGDEWHAEPHNMQEQAENKPAMQRKATSHPLVEELINPTPEDIAELDRSYFGSLGLKPPPPGYHYIWDEPDVVKRDANGNPIMQRNDEPYVEITTTIGFAPTRAQWERLNQFHRELNDAEYNGDTFRAQQLRNDIKQLEADAQGPVPSIGASWAVATENDTDAYREEMERKIEEASKQAYIDFGLGHLVGQ